MAIELNKNQQLATMHKDGAMMVLSGPGSGKTTVITYRIKNLIEIHNVTPSDILVITFTKAASEEMKNRFKEISNYTNVYFGTFHSYFFRIIRNYYNYTLEDILHDNDKINIIKKIIYDLKVNFENEDEFLQNIINEISLIKNELINLEYFEPDSINKSIFENIYYQYENEKAKINKIDFDDMLVKCYELLKSEELVRNFWKEKYKYILIDEFQDINKVQYEAIKLLINDDENIFVVGDDDQSIYGFRGSSPEFLLDFPNNFTNTKSIILNINYRATEQIIKLCNIVIQQNQKRYKKDIKGFGVNYKSPILLRCYDANEEAKRVIEKILNLKKDIPLEEISIIYRTNIQARAIIETLMDYNIEYQIKDKIPTIYDHFIVKDIVCYLKLAINKLDNISFAQIANKPKRYLNKNLLNESIEKCKSSSSALEYIYCHKDIKPWQLERVNELLFHLGQLKNKKVYDAIKYILNVVGYSNYLEEYANFKKIKCSGLFEIAAEFLDSSKEYDKIEDFIIHIENVTTQMKEYYKKGTNNKGVVLTTMHSAKGLEFEVVFVIGCIEGIIPHEKSKSNIHIEEERRLFYVALTRAKKILYLSILKTKYESIAKPSRFLEKLIK